MSSDSPATYLLYLLLQLLWCRPKTKENKDCSVVDVQTVSETFESYIWLWTESEIKAEYTYLT